MRADCWPPSGISSILQLPWAPLEVSEIVFNATIILCKRKFYVVKWWVKDLAVETETIGQRSEDLCAPAIYLEFT